MGALLALVACAALAADPVKRIVLRVDPYYQSARHPDDPPLIAVAPSFDKLLASTRRGDIERARDEIARDPGRITPMTMMVLAARLYDVGLREDAVFWFYNAKHRYYTLAGVADMSSPALAPVAKALAAFVRGLAPAINGYAFCDIDAQREISRKSAEWTGRNPYEALLRPDVPGRLGDRKANYQKALAAIFAATKRERDYLSDPGNVAKLKALRAQNAADERFCWKAP